MRHWAMLTTESAAAAGKYPPHATPSQKKSAVLSSGVAFRISRFELVPQGSGWGRRRGCGEPAWRVGDLGSFPGVLKRGSTGSDSGILGGSRGQSWRGLVRIC